MTSTDTFPSCYPETVYDVTWSEFVVIAFITAAVVSAPWWPRLGASIARGLGRGDSQAGQPSQPHQSHQPHQEEPSDAP